MGSPAPHGRPIHQSGDHRQDQRKRANRCVERADPSDRIIAAVTSKANVKAKLPTHYYLDAGNGLVQPSLVLLEQIRTVDKRRLSGYIGRLDEEHIRGINHALAISIGLIEPVPPKLTLCLCDACADAFRGTGAFVLREAAQGQAEEKVCVYCGQYPGIEYVVTPKGGAGV